MTAGRPDAVHRALARFEPFLYAELSTYDRTLALNDPAVPDHILLGFLRTLGRRDLEVALTMCHRPAVLAAWADVADTGDEIPGDHTTLVCLHEAVPAAEIEDLLQEHARERLLRAYGFGDGEPGAEPDSESDEPDAHLTSAVALLEKVFGPGATQG